MISVATCDQNLSICGCSCPWNVDFFVVGLHRIFLMATKHAKSARHVKLIGMNLGLIFCGWWDVGFATRKPHYTRWLSRHKDGWRWRPNPWHVHSWRANGLGHACFGIIYFMLLVFENEGMCAFNSRQKWCSFGDNILYELMDLGALVPSTPNSPFKKL